jgi:predicted nucleotidyltransferase
MTDFGADALLAAASPLGLLQRDIPALYKAFQLSGQRIEKARAHLAEQLTGQDYTADVVAFGSLARREMTLASDFDYLVINYGLEPTPGATRQVLQAADGLRHVFGDSGNSGNADAFVVRGPGSTGLFGRIVSAPDMVERIGLEEDTNHSQTRRILILEESVSLFQSGLHEKLLNSIIERYLADRVARADSVPRFLLNDLIRYWRTVAVDYQAKTSADHSTYSLRYLKLILSRKLTFAASIVPLFTCRKLAPEQVSGHLVNAFQAPSLLRLLQLEPELEDDTARTALRRCIEIADMFADKLGSQDWRDAVKAECKEGDARNKPYFGSMRELGKELQEHLQTIFTTKPLRPFTDKYMIF